MNSSSSSAGLFWPAGGALDSGWPLVVCACAPDCRGWGISSFPCAFGPYIMRYVAVAVLCFRFASIAAAGFLHGTSASLCWRNSSFLADSRREGGYFATPKSTSRTIPGVGALCPHRSDQYRAQPLLAYFGVGGATVTPSTLSILHGWEVCLQAPGVGARYLAEKKGARYWQADMESFIEHVLLFPILWLLPPFAKRSPAP